MFENFTSFEAILLIVVVLYVSFLISKFITKRKFMSRYGLRELPSSVKVRKTSRSVNENHYFLTYPYWAIQKKTEQRTGALSTTASYGGPASCM